MEIKRDLHLNKIIQSKQNGMIKVVTGIRRCGKSYNVKDADGTSQRRQLEVDFVCNEGSKRCYIQSAYRLDSQEKTEQEVRSLKSIGDSFMKIVITESSNIRHQNDDGILFMDIYDFLLDQNSLNF